MGTEEDIEKIEMEDQCFSTLRAYNWYYISIIILVNISNNLFFSVPQSIYSQSNFILPFFIELQDFRIDLKDELGIFHFRMRNQGFEKLSSSVTEQDQGVRGS